MCRVSTGKQIELTFRSNAENSLAWVCTKQFLYDTCYAVASKHCTQCTQGPIWHGFCMIPPRHPNFWNLKYRCRSSCDRTLTPSKARDTRNACNKNNTLWGKCKAWMMKQIFTVKWIGWSLLCLGKLPEKTSRTCEAWEVQEMNPPAHRA